MSKTPEPLDLLPCPFCGSAEVHCVRHDHKAGPLVGSPFWQTECFDCDASTVRVFESDAAILDMEETCESASRRLWNMRKESAEVTRLRSLLSTMEARAPLPPPLCVTQKALDMFRENGIVFKGEGGHWEKVAFSLYNLMVEADPIIRPTEGPTV